MQKSVVSGARRRNGIELIAAMLEEARNGITKTRLVYRTNLNFVVVKKHLNFLLEKGLIETVNEPAHLYKTSPRGMEFLEEFGKVKQLLGVADETERYEMCAYL